ncbi:Oxygen-dependent coproporphyrinogen-III oxidase [Thelohanellus kitauei]|uniref:coproporphyrinogen oxidase n=1 Tax=Thelohanellus kitauei TaxID=669202 RepID=A0A0C2N8Y0_THEKT|nr:Oxygen-dependent coproporphyrinogen-III oxidase [Thelohanellus kitauei]
MSEPSFLVSKLHTEWPSRPEFMDTTFTDLSVLTASTKTKHMMEYLCFYIQAAFCRQLEGLEDGTKFRVDRWLKPSNTGGGVTCVIENGSVIEKGGVNLSVITGTLSPDNIKQMTSRGHDLSGYENFSAVGISSVIHPVNPHSPTVHFNFRYFELEPKGSEAPLKFWFGGGCDITPYYLYPDDIKKFHTIFKEACDKTDATYYPRFKKWADDYFYLPHREEHRGLGGLFFDDLTGDPKTLLKFVADCALSVMPAYVPIVDHTRKLPYTEKEREWQMVRRGRYVEFNLLYDRGTKFGLNVPGSRIESILMSLPTIAKWVYCHSPEDRSKEDEIMKYIKHPIEWI